MLKADFAPDVKIHWAEGVVFLAALSSRRVRFHSTAARKKKVGQARG